MPAMACGFESHHRHHVRRKLLRSVSPVCVRTGKTSRPQLPSSFPKRSSHGRAPFRFWRTVRIWIDPVRDEIIIHPLRGWMIIPSRTSTGRPETLQRAAEAQNPEVEEYPCPLGSGRRGEQEPVESLTKILQAVQALFSKKRQSSGIILTDARSKLHRSGHVFCRCRGVAADKPTVGRILKTSVDLNPLSVIQTADHAQDKSNSIASN